jgi:hypothetical protein
MPGEVSCLHKKTNYSDVQIGDDDDVVVVAAAVPRGILNFLNCSHNSLHYCCCCLGKET